MPKNFIKSARGFTLIELLVAVTIVAIVTSVGLISYSQAQKLGRDAKRKQDMTTINITLELYYQANKRYPQAGSCSYGSNCYVYSTAGEQWIPALTSGGYIPRLPVDPKNNANGPWNTGNYSYAYGNVATDGSSYDLTTQLENTKDPQRCGIKGWKWSQAFTSGGRYWCPGEEGNNFGGIYSNYIYEGAPDR